MPISNPPPLQSHFSLFSVEVMMILDEFRKLKLVGAETNFQENSAQLGTYHYNTPKARVKILNFLPKY